MIWIYDLDPDFDFLWRAAAQPAPVTGSTARSARSVLGRATLYGSVPSTNPTNWASKSPKQKEES